MGGAIDPGISQLLAIMLGLYLVVLLGIGLVAQRRVTNREEYLVAGRKLPLMLAWPAVFATWFGAGTLLTSADEVRLHGLRRAALDPLGAGVCLLIAGLFFAAPLWRMKLLTLPDFFARRFGRRAEVAASAAMIPGYFGWVAAQFVALAGVMELFFGLDMRVGLVLVATVGMAYTLMGGMWSVTLTDAFQVVLVLLGVAVLGYSVLDQLGSGSVAGGLSRLWNNTTSEQLTLIPTESRLEFMGWMTAFAAGALGNIPGQDLMQRVFSARSEITARRACTVAGVIYLVAGAVPLMIALGSTILLPSHTEQAILPMMAQLFMSPPVAVVFLLALISAVLSTIDSAILSPASVLSHNLLERHRWWRERPLFASRIAVVLVTLASLLAAFVGESAYSLLESSYEIGLVSLLVPLVLGLRGQRGDERSALAGMGVGTALWLLHLAAGWQGFLAPVLGEGVLPVGLTAAALGWLAYQAVAWWPQAQPQASIDDAAAMQCSEGLE